MGIRMKNKGQGILEYALLVACFIAALVAMQIYVKRGFSGRLKQAADSLGEQYDPKRTESDIISSFDSNTTTISKMVPGDYNYEDNENNTYYLFTEDPETGETNINRSFVIQETLVDETSKRAGQETVYEPQEGTDLWD